MRLTSKTLVVDHLNAVAAPICVLPISSHVLAGEPRYNFVAAETLALEALHIPDLRFRINAACSQIETADY